MTVYDQHSGGEFDEIAALNYGDYLDLKHELVSRRRKFCNLKEMSEFLGRSEEDISEFEKYDYDPRASEIREYALAIMTVIHSEATDSQAPTMKALPYSWEGTSKMPSMDSSVSSQDFLPLTRI
ncbi:hypothetical protein OZX73_03970 [Bifidobacterium sp. ESL0775]|uniref:helix-turn-helix domain-containing protein n=1 Tax=Bifidobacterium sp. ESL0775 TaxID=2983230 RepID=UPI0023F972E2|nr:hypothetical protein [Bifidobacterium sp. ESL0775]WEV70021.1 hypothetical protein OZX73_03970 [Bifidobacterium sp. ESL0775]